MPLQRLSLRMTSRQVAFTPRPTGVLPHRMPASSILPQKQRQLGTPTQSTRRGYASKAAPDKDDLNPTSTEYSKSGGDNAAAHSEEAFDPGSTRPETETGSEDSAQGGASSLNVSPGNPEVNQTKQAENSASGKSPEAAGESSGRAATSQRGSPKKSG